MPDEPQFLDDDHAAIHTFAETYLDEDEREDFVNGLLERRGYTKVQSWAPPEPEQDPPARQSRQRQQGGAQPPAPRQGRSPYFKR